MTAPTKKKTQTPEELAHLALARESNASADKLMEERLYLQISNDIYTEEAKDRRSNMERQRAADCLHGYYEFTEEVSGETVGNILYSLRSHERAYPRTPITIELCTPGGSIIDGLRLFDELCRLRRKGHHVTIRVRGEAASMGATILQAADQRECGPNAFIMIHRVAFGAFGKTYEVEDEAEFVKTKLEYRLLRIFAERCGGDPRRFSDLFAKRKDAWYTAEEALDFGLIDEIV